MSLNRPRRLSPALRQAIRDEAAQLADLDDPIAIITAAGETFTAIEAELEHITKVRRAAVRRLRADGWSYDRIAEATKLSKGRVQQLSNDAKRQRN